MKLNSWATDDMYLYFDLKQGNYYYFKLRYVEYSHYMEIIYICKVIFTKS